jgi:hypothetical protein
MVSFEIRSMSGSGLGQQKSLVDDYFASASRFSLAHALSFGTAFSGGPPSVPQAHGPSVLASVMQKQDFVLRQAQT